MTICPYCEGTVTRFKIDGHDGAAPGISWKCISINCPHCNKSLGVQIDPIAIKSDILAALRR